MKTRSTTTSLRRKTSGKATVFLRYRQQLDKQSDLHLDDRSDHQTTPPSSLGDKTKERRKSRKFGVRILSPTTHLFLSRFLPFTGRPALSQMLLFRFSRDIFTCCGGPCKTCRNARTTGSAACYSCYAIYPPKTLFMRKKKTR